MRSTHRSTPEAGSRDRLTPRPARQSLPGGSLSGDSARPTL